MKKISNEHDELFKKFVGCKFTCPKSGTQWEVEQDDGSTLHQQLVGQGRDDTTAWGITCPDCGGFIFYSVVRGQLIHKG